MRRIIAIFTVIAALIASCNVAVYASEHPHEFWAMDEKYQAARNNNNYDDLIKYGNQEIGLYKGMADSKEKRDILTSRYTEIASAYEHKKDYDNAAKTYKLLYEYAEPLSDSKYDEILKGAKAKYDQYISVISMYTDNGASPYYGAKNEIKNGVLFGLNSNAHTRNELDNESMVLVYQELGHELLSHNRHIVEMASKDGIAVEFALNCPNEASDINKIHEKTEYLSQISDMLGKYPDTPVFLRFAAEFDVWSSIPDSSSFKEAFRYVSDYFKSRNSNVAIVWSPNQASNWNVDLDDYYPGDRYVDWVGVSSYAKKYFSGFDNRGGQELFFKNGVNSEPVIALKNIVEKYGDRKPIMLSESGCSHRIIDASGRTKENTTDFALRRLKEYYSYLPMVYPQIKLIAYFDHYVDKSGEQDDYRLSENDAMKNEYLKLTRGGRFIQDKYNGESPVCYRQVTNGINISNTFLLACYAHKYDNETQSVTYFIDGKYAGMSNDIPFSTYISAEGYSGKHRLKAIAKFKDGSTIEQEKDVNIAKSGQNITVEISGDEISFDQEPVIYNDRTMVPMRKIFEELDADVSWNDSTKTAVGKRGDRVITIGVGNSKMYVNSRQILLDTSPIILSDRTLVPVRAVAEGLGCDVGWDGKKYLVSITPKAFEWSEWGTSLPGNVNDDMYYIEKQNEYRFRTRTREKEYYTQDHESFFGYNYVRTDTSYGNWSDWQNDYIRETNNTEVDTREMYEPVKYRYYHYCTGNIDDEEYKYKTAPGHFHDLAIYHELGTFDYSLPIADDGVGHIYYVDSEKYRCSNSCFRWYEVQEGGSYTQYRSRPVLREYVYWQWGDWSNWSRWSEWETGTINYSRYDLDEDEDMDMETRTVYRYKEK